jgi:hypothetical protein
VQHPAAPKPVPQRPRAAPPKEKKRRD